MAGVRTKQWRKVMYETQPYADNHVDDTFLASWKHGAISQSYGFWSMVKSTAVLHQQLAVVAMYFILFTHSWNGNLSATTVMGLECILFSCCLAVWTVLIPSDTIRGDTWFNIPKYSILFVGVVMAMSPILITLTRSLSTDSIIALAMVFTAIHLMFYDYTAQDTTTARWVFEGSIAGISLNAGVFAAVVLSSRLPSTHHVFAFIVLAIIVFAIFPATRNLVRKHSQSAHIALAIIMVLLCLGQLMTLSQPLAALYVGGVLFTSIICPLLVRFYWSKKEVMRGPWDIAKFQALR